VRRAEAGSGSLSMICGGGLPWLIRAIHRQAYRSQIPSLIPRGLVVEGVVEEGSCLNITAHAPALAMPCLLRGLDSRRIHSRYLL
jgi:hypothetical protein